MGKTKVGEIRKMMKNFQDEKTLMVLISNVKKQMNYEVKAMGMLIGEGRDGEKIPCLCFEVGNQIPYTEDEREAKEECERKAAEQKNSKEPPLGLMPRKLWDEKRADEICAAMERYQEAGVVIPAEWIEEYEEIKERNV